MSETITRQNPHVLNKSKPPPHGLEPPPKFPTYQTNLTPSDDRRLRQHERYLADGEIKITFSTTQNGEWSAQETLSHRVILRDEVRNIRETITVLRAKRVGDNAKDGILVNFKQIPTGKGYQRINAQSMSAAQDHCDAWLQIHSTSIADSSAESSIVVEEKVQDDLGPAPGGWDIWFLQKECPGKSVHEYSEDTEGLRAAVHSCLTGLINNAGLLPRPQYSTMLYDPMSKKCNVVCLGNWKECRRDEKLEDKELERWLAKGHGDSGHLSLRQRA